MRRMSFVRRAMGTACQLVRGAVLGCSGALAVVAGILSIQNVGIAEAIMASE